MKDRFMNGFAAGVLADVPVVIIDALAGLFNLDKLDFVHFASILAFDDMQLNIWEYVFTTILQFSFAGLLGVIFAYLIPVIKEKYYYFKAVIFSSGIVWFSVYAIDHFFKIEKKAEIDFMTSVVHYLISIIWAVIMAWIYKWLEKRETV